MNNQVLSRVIGLAADVFDVAPADLTEASTPADHESWDSLAQLNLMVAIEDEFSVQLLAEDIQNMTSIGAIAALVSSRVSA
jgi:acyl carrier protein